MPISIDLWRGPEGTIYEKEKELSESLRIEVDPNKTKFIKELSVSRTSSIFYVNYDNEPRALKVVSVLDHGCMATS
jgi:hypothetical protein